MTWFRVDDGLSTHRKVDDLGEDQALAIAAWTLCGSACGRDLTDGLVTHAALRRTLALWGQKDRERATAALVRVGLWVVDPDGWRFHGWDDYQPTRASVEADREAGKDRQRRSRHRRADVTSPAVTPPVTPSVTRDAAVTHADVTCDESVSHSDPTRPDPTRPDPASFARIRARGLGLVRLGAPPSDAGIAHVEHLHAESRRVIGRAWFGVREMRDGWMGGGSRVSSADVERVRAVIAWAIDPERTGGLDPRVAITRAVEGYGRTDDAVVVRSRRPLALFASDPGRWLSASRASSAEPSDFSRPAPDPDLPEWMTEVTDVR